MAEQKMTLMQRLATWSNKFASNVYIRAIQGGFVAIIPAMILSSVATLLSTYILNDGGILSGFVAADALATVRLACTAITNGTTNLLGFIVVIGISYNLSTYKGFDNVLGSVLCALITMVVLMPTQVQVTIDDFTGLASGVISTTNTGSGGLIVAILVGVFGTKLFMSFSNNDKLRIKMPAGVPEATVKSFNVVIPTVLVGLIFGVVATAFNFFGTNLYQAITTTIQAPISGIATSAVGYAIIQGLGCLFFGFGVHSFVFTSVAMPFTTANYAENTALLAAGEAPIHIVNEAFKVFQRLGSTGCILALVIAIFLVSRRTQHRQVAKIAAIPAIFNIGEPIIFGLPIVFNPIMIIPFVTTTVVTLLLAAGATAIGIIPILTIYTPNTMPALINAFVASGGNLMVVLVQFALLVIDVLIYIPFLKFYESTLPPEEEAEDDSDIDLAALAA